MYAKLNNGSVEKYPYTEYDLQFDNPGTSFRSNALQDAEARNQFNVVEIAIKNKPSYDASKHKLIENTPVLNGKTWEESWETKTKTNEEKSGDWASVRMTRNQKLQETDWQMTKALETGSDAAALKTYRQKLRDIPQDHSNPFSITWPEL